METPQNKKMARSGALLIITVLLALPIWSILIEPNLLLVKDYTITPTSWPQEFDGLKIAVVSDLHVGSLFIDNNKVKQVETQEKSLYHGILH